MHSNDELIRFETLASICSAPNYLGTKIIIPNCHVTCKQKEAFKSHYHKLRLASGRGSLSSLSSIDKIIHPITVFFNIQNGFKIFMKSNTVLPLLVSPLE